MPEKEVYRFVILISVRFDGRVWMCPRSVRIPDVMVVVDLTGVFRGGDLCLAFLFLSSLRGGRVALEALGENRLFALTRLSQPNTVARLPRDL